MASSFTIITDSSCDLPPSLAEKHRLRVAPLTVSLGGGSYSNFLDGSDIPFEDFYGRIASGESVTTSAVNYEQFRIVMESELILGNDVLYIGFSSALSGTYSVGVRAATELAEQYPRRRILTVDSLCASMGQGLLVDLAVSKREAGANIDETYEYVQSIKLKVCHYFTVDDLHQLQRGGRIGGASAAFGTILNIKPVLHVDDNGRLVALSKTRGRQASIKALFDAFCEKAVKPEDQTVFISHGNCREDADQLAEMINERYGCKVVISYVGPVIGAHSGQGTLALFFIADKR